MLPYQLDYTTQFARRSSAPKTFRRVTLFENCNLVVLGGPAIDPPSREGGWKHVNTQKAQIVFQADRDRPYEIYVMDADGDNQRRLTNNPAR